MILRYVFVDYKNDEFFMRQIYGYFLNFKQDIYKKFDYNFLPNLILPFLVNANFIMGAKVESFLNSQYFLI